MFRSPKRVVAGGLLLAFLASAVNVQFLLTSGASVSHLTGDVSRITANALLRPSGWPAEAILLAVAVLGFVLGSTGAGYFIHHPRLSLARPYGQSITAIGVTLVIAGLLEITAPVLSAFLAAACCGYQNALATRYKGLVLRTTHVTGLLTDLGQMLGMRLGGHAIESWKFWLQAGLVLAFMAGALGGAALHLSWIPAPLILLGLIYLCGGIAWSVVKRRETGG